MMEAYEVLPDWQDAEEVAAAYMHEMGFSSVELTPPGRDGGIDITADDAVAQVKHYSTPIGVRPLRELAGVAGLTRSRLFFSTNGYTSEAVAESYGLGVALFVHGPDGRPTAANYVAIVEVLLNDLKAATREFTADHERLLHGLETGEFHCGCCRRATLDAVDEWVDP